MTRREFFHSAAAATAGLAALTSPEGLLAQAREKAKPLHLKVSDLKTFIVKQRRKKLLQLRVRKNLHRSGNHGFRRGFGHQQRGDGCAAIEEHKRYLVGKDPTDIEMHWQAMYRWPRWRSGPILNSAISAVEIALWDILGQALGQPDLETDRRQGSQSRSDVRACRRWDTATICPELVEGEGRGLDRLQSRLHYDRRRCHRPCEIRA